MRRTLLFSATLVAAFAACDSGSPSPSTGGGNDGGTVSSGVCDDFFAVYTGTACGITTLPTTGLDGLKSRFATYCAALINLPGTGFDATHLETCLTALKGAGCDIERADDLDVCKPTPGTLASGAACLSSNQCASGSCATMRVDGGYSACGQCAASAQLGQSCDPSSASVACVSGTACDSTSKTCVAISIGGVGAPCGTGTQDCMSGLRCEYQQTGSTCMQPASQGMSCTPSGCVKGLRCDPTNNTCAPPGQQGAACMYNSDCAVGFGCALATHVCTAMTYGGPGSPCDGATERCFTGSCPAGGADAGTSVCPTVIADGQPCPMPGGTCDSFAECIGGVCIIQNTQTCN
jgi:hypothetical protein